MGIEDEKEEETEIPNSEPEPGRRGSGDLPDSTAGDQPGTSSDSRLVQRAVTCAKQGDPEALHFLYVRYAADVLRYVGSLVHDRHAAEGITQGVFTKLVTDINEYEHREEPFSAWILRVARNAALDHMRQADDPHQES
jgi:RNA polymerase sigma-70 factor (ECF subfamily)